MGCIGAWHGLGQGHLRRSGFSQCVTTFGPVFKLAQSNTVRTPAPFWTRASLGQGGVPPLFADPTPLSSAPTPRLPLTLGTVSDCE